MCKFCRVVKFIAAMFIRFLIFVHQNEFEKVTWTNSAFIACLSRNNEPCNICDAKN